MRLKQEVRTETAGWVGDWSGGGGQSTVGVEFCARTTGPRDFTLGRPPAPQINGLQATLTVVELCAEALHSPTHTKMLLLAELVLFFLILTQPKN